MQYVIRRSDVFTAKRTYWDGRAWVEDINEARYFNRESDARDEDVDAEGGLVFIDELVE